MKKILLLTMLFAFAICNSQQKEKSYIESSCDCISKISENKSNSELMNEVTECIAYGYERHATFIENLAKKHIEKNPNSKEVDVQNWIKKFLSDKLVRECPRFNKILSEVAFPKEDSSDLIKLIASNICEEIDDLEGVDLTWKKIDPIIIKHWELHYEKIDAKYGENSDEFGTDLVKDLVVNCAKYRKFTLKKSK